MGNLGCLTYRATMVYPSESFDPAEKFLYTHPKIQDVQVFGVPDPKYGEELCAWIVPKRGAVLGAEICDARR